jgi:putative transposase
MSPPPTRGHATILPVFIAMVAGWLQRHQQQLITYLIEENHALKAHLGGRRLQLTDTERRCLAAPAHPLGRTRLKEVATIATPDTLIRWYPRLMAQKFDGSPHRRPLGRPRVIEAIEQLVVQMAEKNATWGYRRIQGHSQTWGIPATPSRCRISCAATTWSPLRSAARRA